MIKLFQMTEIHKCTANIPGDPRKCDELVFLITLKVVKIEPNYWVEKKQNFIRIFQISMIWKSDQWSLHNTLISKSGQNAERSGKWPFSNNFWDLVSENVHIITKRNGLTPNMIPLINASELWNAFISHIWDFHDHEWWNGLKKGQRLQKNDHFDDLWPFQMMAKSNMIINIINMLYKCIP